MITTKTTLQEKFPQIIILSESAVFEDKNPIIQYKCAHHGDSKKEKLNKLNTRKFSCFKCAKLLNKGHSFNLNNKPNEAKKIIELQSMFSNQFDYSKFDKTDVFTKGIITCRDHGDFESTINDHVLDYNLQGCPCCSGDGNVASKQVDVIAVNANMNSTLDVEPINLFQPKEKRQATTQSKEQIGTGNTPSDWLDKAKGMFFDLST